MSNNKIKQATKKSKHKGGKGVYNKSYYTAVLVENVLIGGFHIKPLKFTLENY